VEHLNLRRVINEAGDIDYATVENYRSGEFASHLYSWREEDKCRPGVQYNEGRCNLLSNLGQGMAINSRKVRPQLDH
jgi:hypothetical protein